MRRLIVLVPFLLVPFLWTQAAVAQAGVAAHLAPETASTLVERKILAFYPEKASTNGIEGTVVLNVSISEAGAVTEAGVVSGDPDLAEAAVGAVKLWKYKPYVVDGKATRVETQVRFGFHLKGPPPAKFDQEEATSFLPKLLLPDAASTPQNSGPRVRVPSGVAAGLIQKKIEPVYPQEAKDAHVQGTVILHIVIDAAGNVSTVKFVAGPKELYASAADAVGQWKYRPYALEGKPVGVDTTVEIRYALRQ